MPLAKLMPTRRMTRFLLIALAASGLYGQSGQSKPATEFMGRKVTLTESELLDEPGRFPKGPATVCLGGPPQRQCFTQPQDYGLDPTATVVELKKGMSALLFSAASGGVSGFAIRIALLRPGTGEDLEDLFGTLFNELGSGVTLTNQSQHAFLREPSISDAPIFVTADAAWMSGEGHYGSHRYTVSAYVFGGLFPWERDFGETYDLEDQYLTARRYDRDSDDKVDILAAEKPEILARLMRVKAAAEQQSKQPR